MPGGPDTITLTASPLEDTSERPSESRSTYDACSAGRSAYTLAVRSTAVTLEAGSAATVYELAGEYAWPCTDACTEPVAPAESVTKKVNLRLYRQVVGETSCHEGSAVGNVRSVAKPGLSVTGARRI